MSELFKKTKELGFKKNKIIINKNRRNTLMEHIILLSGFSIVSVNKVMIPSLATPTMGYYNYAR